MGTDSLGPEDAFDPLRIPNWFCVIHLAEDLSKPINSILVRKWTVMMVKIVIRERVNTFGIHPCAHYLHTNISMTWTRSIGGFATMCLCRGNYFLLNFQ